MIGLGLELAERSLVAARRPPAQRPAHLAPPPAPVGVRELDRQVLLGDRVRRAVLLPPHPTLDLTQLAGPPLERCRDPVHGDGVRLDRIRGHGTAVANNVDEPRPRNQAREGLRLEEVVGARLDERLASRIGQQLADERPEEIPAGLKRIGVVAGAKRGDRCVEPLGRHSLGDLLGPQPLREVVQADAPVEHGRDPPRIAVEAHRERDRRHARPGCEPRGHRGGTAERRPADEDDLGLLRQGHVLGCEASVRSYVRRSNGAQWYSSRSNRARVAS